MRGVVQGVGFRPFIHRLARELSLAGWARNTSAGVEIVIQGDETQRSRFLSRLRAEAPSLAHVTNVHLEESEQLRLTDFVILPSTLGEQYTLLPPDLATCPLCLEEVFSSQNRRSRYPFTNCTACGPRFTIVRALPCDRRMTTMADFRLCPSCAAEYEDPADRRFHAEPVACPTCGPHVWLTVEHNATTQRPRDTITHAATLLRKGAVIAVQGLGGFHLACDATNASAVQRLRQTKDRWHKPLAVMAATLDEARRYGEISTAEATLLTSVQAPIVLVRKRANSPLASTIAPGNVYLGLMLPYTPLHHLLLRDTGKPLVMTSGNRRDEPLCRTEEEAKVALDGLVDGFLFHDRLIHQRCDDSVVFVTNTGAQPVRRSRGYVPLPVPTPIAAPIPILAVGAELKNTFCLLRAREAFLSQHIGDMGSLATQQHFVTALEHLQGLFKIHPAVVAHDLHPDYTTTRYAQTTDLPLIGVQHHHAHVAACLVDNSITGPVIGAAFDGTGYGTDGAIWGGEFFVADLRNFRRVAHLEYLPLPGGEAAIRRPYRTALAYLTVLSGAIPTLAFVEAIPSTERKITLQMIERKVHTPLTSSCGRLFDAVAAITGLRTQVTYEAQAAIELEAVSSTESHDGVIYPFTIDNGQVRLGPLLAAVVSDTQQHIPVGVIGQRFHHTLAEIVHTVCEQIREKEGLTTVALSGGCWQNRLLLSATISRLRETRFSVYVHHQVPANDGGISLGQAVVAAARLTESS
ncbi:MAG: carbamoyltransferase HypF [Candidatus Binatia bacterium]